ncbi:hypothetical protein CEXT_143001 [Caerostris extrusa]|uniref:Uncharacterized protein n=1 Tax=Caerostris extrusa TaxID=172846 RepID=A0AAV4RT07_CAEEX|nr:hypothetical protein CEXT_143001 [Caerostris extrusa]
MEAMCSGSRSRALKQQVKFSAWLNVRDRIHEFKYDNSTGFSSTTGRFGGKLIRRKNEKIKQKVECRDFSFMTMTFK